MENSNKGQFLAIVGLVILLGVLLMSVPTQIKAQESSGFTGTLKTIIFGSSDSSNSSPAQLSASRQSGGFFSSLFGSSNGIVDPVITIVSVPNSDKVYRIIGGKKHFIPTEEIFYSYGLSLNIVQPISQAELSRYPDARLFVVESDDTETIYYLTNADMLRPIINNKAFYSYGNRMEDVIYISRKEFNFYPRVQFVFVDSPELNRDIYQITGGIRRYVTPAAIRRLNIQSYQVTPISIVEMEEYPVGSPIIY